MSSFVMRFMGPLALTPALTFITPCQALSGKMHWKRLQPGQPSSSATQLQPSAINQEVDPPRPRPGLASRLACAASAATAAHLMTFAWISERDKKTHHASPCYSCVSWSVKQHRDTERKQHTNTPMTRPGQARRGAMLSLIPIA